MPLNTNQKTFIDSIIGHLLDFSSSAIELTQQIEQLKVALTPDAPKSNNYYWLGQCLLNPETNLSGLEKQTIVGQPSSASIGETQQYIVSQIKSKINKASIKDLFKELEKQIKKNIKVVFKSKAQFIPAGENPLTEMPNLRGKIYTRTLRVSQNYIEEVNFLTTTAEVDITVTLSDNSVTKTTLPLGEIPNFRTDRESDNYFDNLKIRAERKALEFAGKTVIDKLYSNQLIKRDARDTAKKDAFVNIIITSKYYFDLLYQRKLSLNLFLGCTEIQANNLIDPILIDLIQYKSIRMSDAKMLNKEEKRVATSPVFHLLLKDKKIKITDIIGISERRSKFLIQPIIANLIKQNVLTLSQAKKLPTYLLDARFDREKPKERADYQSNLDFILTPLNVINSDSFQCFLRKNMVNWNQLINITMEQCKLFFNDNFTTLITEEKITLHDILKLTSDAIDFITQFPYLCHWHKQSLFHLNQLNRCSNDDFTYLNGTIYAKRLYAFATDEPYFIEDQADTMDVFLLEIPLAAADCGITIAELQEEIMGNLLSIIKDDLIQTNTKYNTNQQRQITRMVQQINSCLSIEPLIWRNQFTNFISLVHEIHGAESYKSNKNDYLDFDGIMFPAAKRRKCHEEGSLLLTLCENLLQLEVFNQLIVADNDHAMRM